MNAVKPPEVLDALARADLTRLGFRDADAADCRTLIASLADAPERLSRVVDLAGKLHARIGDFFSEDLPVRDDGGLASFEEGLMTLLALVAVSAPVHEAYVARGIPSEVAWRSLADLGQQVHVFREIFGFFGLCSQTWCVANFTGRHLWLGRLQFTLEQAEAAGEYACGIHIPESGPLTPSLVDESLAAAGDLVPRTYPEYPVTDFVLHSWMLDPDLMACLEPESNLARFARRFRLLGGSEPGLHDALFFIFQKEPRLQPLDLSALPRDSSLRRAALSRPLEELRVASGRLVT